MVFSWPYRGGGGVGKVYASGSGKGGGVCGILVVLGAALPVELSHPRAPGFPAHLWLCFFRYRPKAFYLKVFSEKASATSEMRQKCVTNASCFIWKRGTFRNASKMRLKSVKNARNTFGGTHLLDNTDFYAQAFFKG